MRPIEHIGEPEARRLAGLLFDLDDTLLDHGQLTEHAYSALFRLREHGLKLVAVTGRPAGWGEVIARQWPVEAVVTENGAITIAREGTTIVRIDPISGFDRLRRRELVQEIAAEVRAAFPELEPTDDVHARVSDFTLDIGEHKRVDEDVVARACALIERLGARTTTSSVHLHISLDSDDKASGAVRVLGSRLGEDPTRALSRWAFIGDSDNDAACFGAFQTTIAVANFRARVSRAPRYRTHAARGAGFAEAARVLGERIGARPGVR